MDIKSIIKEKGYTIQDVAKKMGVNRVTLTLTLQGNPTYKKLKEIAETKQITLPLVKEKIVNSPPLSSIKKTSTKPIR